MVMQVRYLYEAEGNKKAKDAKAVSFVRSVLMIFLSLLKRLQCTNVYWKFNCLEFYVVTMYPETCDELFWDSYCFI